MKIKAMCIGDNSMILTAPFEVINDYEAILFLREIGEANTMAQFQYLVAAYNYSNDNLEELVFSPLEASEWVLDFGYYNKFVTDYLAIINVCDDAVIFKDEKSMILPKRSNGLVCNGEIVRCPENDMKTQPDIYEALRDTDWTAWEANTGHALHIGAEIYGNDFEITVSGDTPMGIIRAVRNEIDRVNIDRWCLDFADEVDTVKELSDMYDELESALEELAEAMDEWEEDIND